MAEQREAPVHKIKYGRINGWIYHQGPEGYGDYQFEYFRWFKSTPRSNWQKARRISYHRDFHDLAGCLERADIWIAKQEGRHIPQTEESSFSPQEIAAILHCWDQFAGLIQSQKRSGSLKNGFVLHSEK